MTTLLIAEHEHATLKDSTNKALTAATQLGAEVHVLVAGGGEGTKAAAEVAAKLAGVTKVLLAEGDAYAHDLAEPLAALIVALAPSYDAFVAPATSRFKNVMPRVAALLDVMQVSEIIKVISPGTLPRPVSRPQFFLLGPVSLDGLRAAHLSREPARHRNVPAGSGWEVVSLGDSRSHLAQHAGRRQRDARLAHLCRSRSRADRRGASVVRGRSAGCRAGGNCLCVGLYYHRFVSFVVSVGTLPTLERRRQDAHAARSARQHSRGDRHKTSQNPRNPRFRSTVAGTRRVLPSRQSLLGLRAPLHAHAMPGVFHYSRAKRFPLSLRGFADRGQKHRLALRSNRALGVLLSAARLSREYAPHPLLRSGNWSPADFSHQQFFLAHTPHSATVQVPLASRTVLQMDQATPAHQSVLRTLRERREGANLDGHHGLRAGGHRAQASGTGLGTPRHVADSERLPVRENSVDSSVYADRSETRGTRGR